MQSLSLAYYQRVMLWNMIGNYSAPNLKEASVYLRIIEKIRLSDIEQVETEFTSTGNQYGWKLPAPSYGNCVVDLENEEAKALATAIESATPVRVIDAEWLSNMVAELRHPVLELVTNAPSN
jgi:hypothetical protein